MTKQIADIGDKLSEPQDNTKASNGAVTKVLADDTAVKTGLLPAIPKAQPASSRRTLKARAQVHNAIRARSPLRTQQPGTGKFRLQAKSAPEQGRAKRLNLDVPGKKNSTGRPAKAAEQMNAHARSNPIVMSHVPSPAPAHVGKAHHEGRGDGPQIVVTNRHLRASQHQDQQRFVREARSTASDAHVMHQISAQSLMRRPSSSSGRDSWDSYMDEMMTSSARSASSNGDFRPATPLDLGCRLSTVVETNVTPTTTAAPTEYDVTEGTNTQPRAPHPSDGFFTSFTDFLNIELEPDSESMDQDGMADFYSDKYALYLQNGDITMFAKARQSAMAKQPPLSPAELMDFDKL